MSVTFNQALRDSPTSTIPGEDRRRAGPRGQSAETDRQTDRQTPLLLRANDNGKAQRVVKRQTLSPLPPSLPPSLST